MYNYLTSVLILLLITVISHPELYTQDRTSSLLLKGQKFYKAGELDSAITVFKTATEVDSMKGDAYQLLAKSYLTKGTIRYRQRAKEAIRKAVQLEPDNVEYQLIHAEILVAQSFKENARALLEDIIVQYPDNPEALYMLGNIYQEHLKKLTNKIDLPKGDETTLYDTHYLSYLKEYQYMDTGETTAYSRAMKKILADGPDPIFSFQKYFQQEYDKTESTYQRLKAISPDYKDVSRQYALLAYEGRDWDRMIELAHEFILEQPGNREAYLLLGLAYLRKGNYARAHELFGVFREHLLPEELNYFEHFDQFLSAAEQEIIDQMSPTERSEFHYKFWTSRDPFFLTDYNERELEHLGRVAEASLLFGNPVKNINGWETDRGLIWVRYGPPNQQLNEINERGMETSLWWYYDDFTFRFYEFPVGSGNIKFYYASYLPFERVAQDIQKEYKDQFRMIIRGKKFNVPHLIADFRGEGGQTRVEVCYGVPLHELSCVPYSDQSAVSVKQGLFLFNEDWNEEYSEQKTIEFPSSSIPDSGIQHIAPVLHRLQVEPGMHFVIIEMLDDSSGNIGSVRKGLDVESYAYDSLQISDVLLAEKVDIQESASSASADIVGYTPRVTRTYGKPEPLFIYFEVYNLWTDTGTGKTAFQVDYIIQRQQEEEPSSILSAIGSLFRRHKDTSRLSESVEYSGRESEEKLYLEVDTGTLLSGTYRLSLHVTDQIATHSVQKQSEFVVE